MTEDAAEDGPDSPSAVPFISRVRIKNYKSIASCDVRLGPLTILVGPNGSGKSNFLDALAFMTRALATTPEEAIDERDGLGELIRRVPEDAGSTSARSMTRAGRSSGRSSIPSVSSCAATSLCPLRRTTVSQSRDRFMDPNNYRLDCREGRLRCSHSSAGGWRRSRAARRRRRLPSGTRPAVAGTCARGTVGQANHRRTRQPRVRGLVPCCGSVPCGLRHLCQA
jgi:energy-coupling factor transporter ATP-binding protein EcfA2